MQIVKLRRYMLNYLEIITAIPSIFLILSGIEGCMETKREMLILYTLIPEDCFDESQI
jgi:hypothetical protein